MHWTVLKNSVLRPFYLLLDYIHRDIFLVVTLKKVSFPKYLCNLKFLEELLEKEIQVFQR